MVLVILLPVPTTSSGQCYSSVRPPCRVDHQNDGHDTNCQRGDAEDQCRDQTPRNHANTNSRAGGRGLIGAAGSAWRKWVEIMIVMPATTIVAAWVVLVPHATPLPKATIFDAAATHTHSTDPRRRIELVWAPAVASRQPPTPNCVAAQRGARPGCGNAKRTISSKAFELITPAEARRRFALPEACLNEQVTVFVQRNYRLRTLRAARSWQTIWAVIEATAASLCSVQPLVESLVLAPEIRKDLLCCDRRQQRCRGQARHRNAVPTGSTAQEEVQRRRR